MADDTTDPEPKGIGGLIGDFVDDLREPWVGIVENLFAIALPLLMKELDGEQTPVEIALPTVKALLGLGIQGLEDLAKQTPPAVVQRQIDDAVLALLETLKYGPKPLP